MTNLKHGPRLVIIGVGHVGSQVLTEAVRAGIFSEIVTIDKKEGTAYGEALDHHQASALPGDPGVTLRSGDYDDCKDADVIICAAGPSIIPDGSGSQPDRTSLTGINAKEIRQVMTDLTSVTRDPALIFITNPLDTMVFLAQTSSITRARLARARCSILPGCAASWPIASAFPRRRCPAT